MAPTALLPLMRVCLGGTFDPFHVGHEALLAKALQLAGPDGAIFIGLVSDDFSATKRQRTVALLDQRKKRLLDWLKAHGARIDVTINELTDTQGPSATGDYDAIVVSVETEPTAHRINQTRHDNDLEPLAIHAVPYTLGQDLLPVSATRVAAGDIDRDGRRLEPLRIAVGTMNPTKLDATRHAFQRFLGDDLAVELSPRDVPSGVPEQPFDTATLSGAENRALRALERDDEPKPDYAVGIEAGLVQDPTGGWLDVQHCVIVDRTGHRTHGHGPGFTYPDHVIDRVRAGETVGQVLAEASGDSDIGRTQGAVGWLTRGVLDRTRLTELAVEAALVPRVRRAFYDGLPEPHP